MGDAIVRDQLVQRHGLAVHKVQLSRDRRTAFILWDSNPGSAAACAESLQRNAYRLRSSVAKIAKAKHTPRLEFRHDHLPPQQAAVARALEWAEVDAAAGEHPDAALAAAVDAMQAAIPPKPWHLEKGLQRGEEGEEAGAEEDKPGPQRMGQ